ncbi:MAG: hypothetical protein GY862_19825 [Gammaproteobacteria bacterium]|nr:hypothetical protein [Gammaproteobacteria bacterium]
MQTKLTDEQGLWRKAAKRLELIYLPPLPTAEEREALLAALPQKPLEMSVREWLKLCRADIRKSKTPPSRVCLRPLAEIVRLAADSGKEKYPLPDPGRFLESKDERFRLAITAETPDNIHITLKALGFAMGEFAGRHLGVAGAATPETLLVDFILDNRGRGEGVMEDTPENRHALLRPLIVLVEE